MESLLTDEMENSLFVLGTEPLKNKIAGLQNELAITLVLLEKLQNKLIGG